MKRFVIALSFILLAGAGCAASTPTMPPAPSNEAPPSAAGSTAPNFAGVWELKSFAPTGKAAVDASKLGMTLTIDPSGRLSAVVCNAMSGEYAIEQGPTLQVAAITSTKMFCTGEKGEIETAFTQGLSTGLRLEGGGDALTLRTKDGATFSYVRPANGDTGIPMDTGSGAAGTSPSRIGAPSDDAAPPSGPDLTYSGTVVSVNLEPIAADGPAVVTLRTSAGMNVKINVPSFGINLCKARASIADVSTLKTGDKIEARGAVGADGTIVPCQSEAHYLRVVKK